MVVSILHSTISASKELQERVQLCAGLLRMRTRDVEVTRKLLVMEDFGLLSVGTTRLQQDIKSFIKYIANSFFLVDRNLDRSHFTLLHTFNSTLFLCHKALVTNSGLSASPMEMTSHYRTTCTTSIVVIIWVLWALTNITGTAESGH